MRATQPSIRILIFVGAVASAFAAAVLVGGLVGPIGTSAGATPVPAESGHGHDGGHADPAAGPQAAGLAVNSAGYTLQVLSAPTAAGSPAELAFRIVGRPQRRSPRT